MQYRIDNKVVVQMKFESFPFDIQILFRKIHFKYCWIRQPQKKSWIPLKAKLKNFHALKISDA